MDNIDYHLTIFFSGHVQGVGFRYQTVRIAMGFEVTGTVKNLNDGRVKVDVTGNKIEVLKFKKEIENQMSSFIKKVEQEEDANIQLYTDFKISY